MKPSPTTVFVVDDDPSVLKGISRLLYSAGLFVAAFISPIEFLERCDTETPGCVVLDVAMPGLNGLELQKALADRGAVWPIIFLTGRGDIPISVRAMKLGAADFLLKPVDRDNLIDAVLNAIEKDRANRIERAKRAEIDQRLSMLTSREREVLAQVVSGRLNKQIAGDLGTVEKTIKVHRAHVMEKMKARSLAELVRLADRAGIRPKLPAV